MPPLRHLLLDGTGLSKRVELEGLSSMAAQLSSEENKTKVLQAMSYYDIIFQIKYSAHQFSRSYIKAIFLMTIFM